MSQQNHLCVVRTETGVKITQWGSTIFDETLLLSIAKTCWRTLKIYGYAKYIYFHGSSNFMTEREIDIKDSLIDAHHVKAVKDIMINIFHQDKSTQIIKPIPSEKLDKLYIHSLKLIYQEIPHYRYIEYVKKGSPEADMVLALERKNIKIPDMKLRPTITRETSLSSMILSITRHSKERSKLLWMKAIIGVRFYCRVKKLYATSHKVLVNIRKLRRKTKNRINKRAPHLCHHLEAFVNKCPMVIKRVISDMIIDGIIEEIDKHTFLLILQLPPHFIKDKLYSL